MKARFIVLWNKPTDLDAFEEHYRTKHVPLAKRMAKLKRYTLSRNVALIRGDEPCYLIAELEWNSMGDLSQDFQSAAGQATAQDVAILSQWSSGVQSMTYEVEDV